MGPPLIHVVLQVLTYVACGLALALKQIPLTLSEPGDGCSIQIPVDHFARDPHLRIYNNRYWLNTTFYRPGGPVFLYDGGERGVPNYGGSIFLPSHPVMLLAERFNGIALVLEHRYYGQSIPVPVNINSSRDVLREAYQYLNTEQALQDGVYLAHNFKPPGLEDYWEILSPSSNLTSWIWIGASYPGARGAMIRARNPETFKAAWSSSAAIQVSVEFPEYYAHMGRDLSPHCRQIIQAVNQFVDSVLNTGSILAKWQLRWDIARRRRTQSIAEKLNFVAFGTEYRVGRYIAGVLAFDWQSEGMKGQMNATCHTLSQISLNTKHDLHRAVSTVLDIAIGNLEERIGSGRQPYPLDVQSWTYQSCTEYPFLRTAAPDSEYNVISTHLTPENVWEDECRLRFPWLSFPPEKMSVPLSYANWDKDVPNVMWTTGTADPWHGVSMIPRLSLRPDAPTHRKPTRQVPRCGEVAGDDKVFGLLFEGGRHGDDLRIASPQSRLAVDLFTEALNAWLPC